MNSTSILALVCLGTIGTVSAQSLDSLLRRGAAELQRAAEQAARSAATPASAPAPARPPATPASPPVPPTPKASPVVQGAQQPAWVQWLSAPLPLPESPPGAWFGWDNQYGRVRGTFERGGITRSEGEAWDRQLRAVADFLRSAPVLATQVPAGFFPELFGHIDVLDAGGYAARPKQAPIVGGVTLYAWPPSDVRVDPGGAPKTVPGAHNISFRLELNYVYPPGSDPWMGDAQGEFAPLRKQGEFAGFPLYGNSLVVTRGGRLPFVPVSQQRALAAFVAWHEKRIAGEDEERRRRRKSYEDYVSPEGRARRQAAIEAEAQGVHPTLSDQARRRAEAIDGRREQDLLVEANKGPGPVATAVAEARRRLAALSDVERGEPAWMLPARGEALLEIVPQGTPGALPLVAFDTGFFDPRRPRTTLRVAQVRELHNIAECAQAGRAACAVYLRLLQQVDWRAFADRFLE